MENLIVYLFFALIFWLVMKRHVGTIKTLFANSSNFRLMIICAVYIMLIFLFAKIYQKTYNANSRSFVFASDIAKTNIEELNRNDSSVTADLQYQQYFCDSVNQMVFLKRQPIILEPPGTYERTFRYRVGSVFVDIDINELYCHKGIKNTKHGICIWDSTRNYFPKEIFLDQTIDTIPYDTFAVLHSLLSKRLSQIISQIKNSTPNIVPKWTYLDFLYFSTITQATVGYGDMLPNSKTVRFLVTIQTLLGVFLTVFLIASSLWKVKE